jgi:flavodoxin
MILTAILLSCCSSESDVKAQEMQPSSSGKVLVAYFSFTSNTKAYAEKIAEITGGDLYEIVPEVAYGSENSNYYDQSTRAYKEQYNTGGEQRPAIKETLENASQYDVVFLGSPIWYGKSPRVILTFLDKYSFEGKTVIPFVTSAASSISNVNSELPSTYPDINWKEGRRLNGISDADLRTWVQSFVGTTTQKLYLTIGGVTKTATMVSNSSTEALVAQLQQGNITYEAHDYGNFEKVGPLGRSLPTSNSQITTQAGDVILYNGNQLVLFYGTNSWSYTRIGKMEYGTLDELKTFLKAGQGKISVTLSL